jgi:hypothetical protein
MYTYDSQLSTIFRNIALHNPPQKLELIQQTKGDIGINKEFGDFLGDICNLKQQKRRCGATGQKQLDIWEQQLVEARNPQLLTFFLQNG